MKNLTDFYERHQMMAFLSSENHMCKNYIHIKNTGRHITINSGCLGYVITASFFIFFLHS